jgi:acetyl esterase/lipase
MRRGELGVIDTADRQREMNTCRTLALNGYAVMSINYKLSIKDKATWPQSVLDAKTAVRWLRKNAERLQINPAKIGALGYSAGGNLASMLAVTQPKDGFEPPGEGATAIACAADIYGAVDLINYHDMKMFNKTRAEAPELYKKGSPITYLDKSDPPMLLIHGTADETVPMSQSETFAKALKEADAPHELVIIPGAPHTFDLEPKQRDLRPVVLGFLDKHLKAPAH